MYTWPKEMPTKKKLADVVTKTTKYLQQYFFGFSYVLNETH